MALLTIELMNRCWPHGNQHTPGLREGIVAASERVFTKDKLDTPLLVAHAMAQFSEECGQGLEMIESLNYTAKRLLEIFGTHFTPSMAQRWQHNERMIGDIAYGGRMGNKPPPSDDGYNYRGRGLSQVTGFDGYKKLQAKLLEQGVNIDIMSTPDLVCAPQYTLECGVLDFILCGCLPHAQKDDVVAVTRALNGGLNGLAERERQLDLWKRELHVSATASKVPRQDSGQARPARSSPSGSAGRVRRSGSPPATA